MWYQPQPNMKASTQEHIPVKEIRDGVLLLKNGNYAIILSTSAVNFGLLSENEQIAIISSFAGLLNSLSFSIQIVIRSKRLDVTDYLKLLDAAYQKQTNPLLANMMMRYRSFIERTVRENDVLDKQFYIVVSLSSLEVGLSQDKEANFKKALTLIAPRRDHIIRQLARIGLKSTQLNHKKLAELFYDLYNFDSQPQAIEASTETQPAQSATIAAPPTTLPTPPVVAPVVPAPTPAPQAPTYTQTPAAPNATNQAAAPLPSMPARTARPVPPFVTEELKDDYGHGSSA